MKKLMTIGLAAAVLFAFAGQAKATALETSGEYRARFWNLYSYMADGKGAEFWDQRLRLTLTWPVAEGVRLQARADIMEGMWGDRLLAKTEVPGVDGAPVTYRYDANSNSRPAVAWDQVNLMFAIPGTPVTITVGRMAAAWGPGIFVAADNRDRFKLTAKFGDTTALYTYDKYTEVGGFHDSDSLGDRTQHSIGAVSKLAGFNVGFIYGLIQDETNPEHDVALHAADVYAMGKAGPVGLKAEVAYAIGTDSHGGADVDLTGLLVYLGASMPAGPVTIGLESAYAQGNDPGTIKNEGALRSDYQSPFWSVILFNNMDYQGYDNQNDIANDAGLTNALAGKASVAMELAPGLSMYGALVYATRDQVAAGKDKPLGAEIDLVVNYAIAEKVSLMVGGGYLMAGDYYGDVDDPWGAVVAFTTKF